MRTVYALLSIYKLLVKAGLIKPGHHNPYFLVPLHSLGHAPALLSLLANQDSYTDLFPVSLHPYKYDPGYRPSLPLTILLCLIPST